MCVVRAAPVFAARWSKIEGVMGTNWGSETSSSRALCFPDANALSLSACLLQTAHVHLYAFKRAFKMHCILSLPGPY